MAVQKYSGGSRSNQLFGAITVGDPSGAGVGTPLKRIDVGTFTVNTTTITQSTQKTGTFTLVGATTGDIVIVFPSTALDSGITLNAGANVTATSTVTVTFVNETSASVVQTSGLTNRYLHIKL